MVILGYTELLRQEARPDQAGKIITAVEEAARTIKHHIEFTKEYQEVGIHAPAWQDLREVIVRAGGRCSLGKVRLAIGVEGVELLADPLLERALYNLIDNALRYGGEAMTEIRITSREENGAVLLEFADNGAGIPAEDKPRLFTKGFGKNTGLGLFLSQEILSITGIAITENGEPGKGARFVITVPAGMYRS